MAFIGYDPIIGTVKLTDVDPDGPGPLSPKSARQSFTFEMIRGYDANLGGGEFVYAQAGGTIAAGGVVQFNQSQDSGGKMVNSAVNWAGTANSGDVLGVALVALTSGQWGWFQVSGNAVVNCSGAPAVGNPCYWQAAGVVSPTAVAGKQVIGAKFATAAGATLGSGGSAIVLSGTQAVALLDRPNVQTQIT